MIQWMIFSVISDPSVASSTGSSSRWYHCLKTRLYIFLWWCFLLWWQLEFWSAFKITRKLHSLLRRVRILLPSTQCRILPEDKYSSCQQFCYDVYDKILTHDATCGTKRASQKILSTHKYRREMSSRRLPSSILHKKVCLRCCLSALSLWRVYLVQTS